MRIPKQTRILGHPVQSYFARKALELDDCEMALGLAHLFTNKIGICTAMDGEAISESIVAEAYMHEICHHISAKLGLELIESQIAGMACGLLQVIRDNRLDFLNTEDVMGKKGKGKKKAVVVGKGKKGK